MNWIYVIIAGLLEIPFAMSMKYGEGFTRLWPSLLFLLTGGTSMYLLTQAVKVLPIGTAYAVWVGIGATGTALVGIVFLKESATAGRLLALAIIVIGIIALRLVEAK